MITVVGSSNTDFSVRVDRFPAVGETVLADEEFFVCGGGKGANQAAAIAKLGGKANFIANIGIDHFGNDRERELKRFGVNTSCVKKDKAHHSGAAFILVDKNGRNLITVSPGSNGFLKADDILERAAYIKRSDILLLQLEIPLSAVKAAISIAKRYGRKVILNPAPVCSRLSRDILSKVDILIPNECELAMLGSATLLLKAGVGCVIITQGKKGVLLVNRRGTKFFRARRVKAVDTTCAGDAFCGAFALGLDRGNSIEAAIEFANCAAALTCTKLGAQCSLPSLREVKISFPECRNFLRVTSECRRSSKEVSTFGIRRDDCIKKET